VQALEVDERCVKALYWRGRANERLQLYDNALFDLKVCNSKIRHRVNAVGTFGHDKAVFVNIF
jgi:hypothetical protein